MDFANSTRQLKIGYSGKGLLQGHPWCPDDLPRLWDRLEREQVSERSFEKRSSVCLFDYNPVLFYLFLSMILQRPHQTGSLYSACRLTLTSCILT